MSLPGRPVQNNASQTLERFHIYLLLVLGIAFVGAGIVALGFAGDSSAAIGVGAGAVVAAGLIAVFVALGGSRLVIEEKRALNDTTSTEPLIRKGPERR